MPNDTPISPKILEQFLNLRETITKILTSPTRGQADPNTPKVSAKYKHRTWSRATNPVYYKEPYAKWLKNILDKMLADEKCEQDIKLKCVDYGNCSRKTLQLRIIMAWNYLIDYLDKDEVYSKLRSSVKISQSTEGWILKWKCKVDFRDNAGEAVPHTDTVEKLDKIDWLGRLQQFIEDNKDMTKLQIREIDLSKDQQEMVRNLIFGLPNFVIVNIDGKGFTIVCSYALSREVNKKK